MIKIDLQDAYMLVPVAPKSRSLLVFIFDGKIYRFKVMPFGLNSAPRIFTKLFKPILRLLRSQGMLLIIYLDDILPIAPTADLCLAQGKFLMKLVQDLGFLVNMNKSVLTPTQRKIFLGFLIDSVNMTISLPEEKQLAIIQKAVVPHKQERTADLFHCSGIFSFPSKRHSCSAVSGQYCCCKLSESCRGTRSQALSDLAIAIWEWCLQRRVYLSAIHIPGIVNKTPDGLSCQKLESTEWMLDSSVFRQIVAVYQQPQVDLFASHLNHKLPNYFFLDPGSTGYGNRCFQHSMEIQSVLPVSSFFLSFRNIFRK